MPLLGSAVDLLWLPERVGRHGVPTGRRPPFLKSTVESILANETVWHADDVALTRNRFPFADRQVLLWAEQPLREPPLAMLEIAFELEHRTDGTVLINSTGAAASITRAHAHLIGERAPFLDALETVTEDFSSLVEEQGVIVERICPFLGFVLRGAPLPRARAAHRLLELRTSPSFNLVSSAGSTYLFPRTSVEIPDPHFPHALGAAEIWGRWCYADERAFAAATASDLEAALAAGLFR